MPSRRHPPAQSPSCFSARKSTAPTLEHHAWHADDGESFFAAVDSEGSVVSAWHAVDIVPPGTPVEWTPCGPRAELARMTADMRRGLLHPMGGRTVDWPCSIDEPLQ